MRYHLTPVRMAITERTKDNKFWSDMEKREHCVLSGMKISIDIMEAVWSSLKC
jgi:hypothetical protein